MIEKIKKITERGIKSSIKTVFYQKRKPILKKRLRDKYFSQKKLSDEDFIDLIKKQYVGSQKNISETVKSLLTHFDDRKIPKFNLDSKSINRIVEVMKNDYPAEVTETLNRAEFALNGVYRWITPNCPIFDNKIDWHSTFVENGSWPLTFFMELDYSGEKRPGDVRQNWEFNRHQYFSTLGKAYLFTNDEKFAKEFVSQIDDWIDSNPVGFGVQWLHSQETAIRMISWIWAYYYFKNSSNFTNDIKLKFFKSLYEHAEYTNLTLSHDLITHNHLVSEICGLLFFSVLFPEFKSSDKWKKTGLRIFKRELLKQVWENGPQAELSTNYHLFVLDSFLNVKIILDKNGHSISRELNDRIEKMIEYVMNFLRPDGSFPLIGDNDSGRVYKLSEKDAKDRRSYLSTGAVLFNRPDFKYSAGKFFEESFWLLGLSGLNKFNNVNSIPQSEKAAVYENIGNAFYKTGSDIHSIYFLFRSGPSKLRKEVSFGHNHADYLSFNLSFGGVNFFVDPGTFQYSLDDNWRYYFRSTNAHNTISIDGEDHLDVKSFRFGIPEIKTARINDHQLTDDYFYINATHFGYDKKGITHNRKVFVSKESFVIIVDHIDGIGKHLIRRNFNVGRAEIQQLGNSRLLLELENRKAVINYLNEVNVSVEKGSIDPVAGWASEIYGDKHEASIIFDERNTQLPYNTAVIINLEDESPFEVKDFKLGADKQSFKIVKGSNQYLIVFDRKLNFLKKVNK